jgi:hypothetical protein
MFLVLLTSALANPGAATQPILSQADRVRANELPHYATARFELDTGEVWYGSMVIAVYDGGEARVEFAGGDETMQDVVAGNFELVGQTDGRALHARFSAEGGPQALQANHGTLSLSRRNTERAEAAAALSPVVETELRVDEDGSFALAVVGVNPSRNRVQVRAFGRAVGVCWTTENHTLKRVADMSGRPDCQRLIGHL